VDELILDESVDFTENAQKAGVDINLEIWCEMFHIFQLIPFLPETKRALESIAVFVSQKFIDDIQSP